MSIRRPQSFLWLALGLLLLLPASASAQGVLNKELALIEQILGTDVPLTKDEQKCVNTSNKNAQKIADAQGKNYSSCIKDFAKGKNGSADVCTAADAKGKLSKANSKYDSKTAKDCTMGSGFMNIADNATVKAVAKDKELAILEMIFGTDGGIDGAIIAEADSKPDSKCQQAIVKAVFKCQATKWKEYNKCKKNKIKGKDTTQATSASEVQDECTGTGAGSIPDGKGKIAKKCDFSSTISKKCPNNVFPGCPGDNAALNACLDAFVECKWCLANNTIGGLNRNCDLFDDGVEDDSCAPLVDVLFLLDTTGSKVGDYGGAAAAIPAKVAALETAINFAKPAPVNLRYSLAKYEDFPLCAAGALPADTPYRVLAGPAVTVAPAAAAIPVPAAGSGGDVPESMTYALDQARLNVAAPALKPFRPGSSRCIIIISDSDSRDPDACTAPPFPGLTHAGVGAALAAAKIRVFYLDCSDSCCAPGVFTVTAATGGFESNINGAPEAVFADAIWAFHP